MSQAKVDRYKKEKADDGVDVINKAAENSERILNSYVEEVGKPSAYTNRC